MADAAYYELAGRFPGGRICWTKGSKYERYVIDVLIREDGSEVVFLGSVVDNMRSTAVKAENVTLTNQYHTGDGNFYPITNSSLHDQYRTDDELRAMGREDVIYDPEKEVTYGVTLIREEDAVFPRGVSL